MNKNPGRVFEADFEQSCNDQKIFFNRIKDIYVPPDLRNRIKFPPNKFDNFIFDGILVPLELKSSAQKSFSLDEKIIKSHQISSLLDAAQYEKVFPGFIFNFREYNNATYFVPIQEFVMYQSATKDEPKREYKSKILKSSIPLNICAEVGIKVLSEKKRVHYRYDVVGLVRDIKEKYHG